MVHSVREMRAARRPLLDVTTGAYEIGFTWNAQLQAQGTLLAGRAVKYHPTQGQSSAASVSNWGLLVDLQNLSDNAATAIHSSCALRPALSPRQVAMLGLSDGIGNNPEYRLSWSKGRYTLSGLGGGSGWLDSFTIPLPLISNLLIDQPRVVDLSPHTLDNLLLLLYREALLAAQVGSAAVYCRPSIVVQVSYQTPLGETHYRKFLIDMTIQHCSFTSDGVARDALYGCPSNWTVFNARVTFAIRSAAARLPWRFRFTPIRHVWRGMHLAGQSYYGFRHDPIDRVVTRTLKRTSARIGLWWDQRDRSRDWKATMKERIS